MKNTTAKQLIADKKFLKGVRKVILKRQLIGVVEDAAYTLRDSLAYWQKLKVSLSDARKVVRAAMK